MEKTFQAEGVSMLDHGRSVWGTYERLVSALTLGQSLLHGTTAEDATLAAFPRLPSWLSESWPVLERLQLPREVMKEYLILHDCGKPFCREEDSEGRQHFPEHASVSAKVYKAAFVSGTGDGGQEGAALDHETIQILIAHDMALHTAKAEEIPALLEKLGAPVTASLLLSAVAEVYANAEMFGGTDSTSFKIKMKHLDRRGRQLLSLLEGPKTRKKQQIEKKEEAS